MDGSFIDIDVDSYQVCDRHKAELRNRPTRVKPLYNSEQQYEAHLNTHIARLGVLQEQFYGANRYALLIIVQGMDAAGKDGTIDHVMKGFGPQGCEAFSFKTPSVEELRHDFLWRTTRDLPERRKISIFNRSYYEEVLIIRVHPEMLRAEGRAGSAAALPDLWRKRYRSINALEQHLHENGTRVLKFFLHLSQKEQTRRFLARIDDPGKNWKLSSADIEERKFWNDYTSAYEACLDATSTEEAPWYVVPADEKDISRLIVSQILLHTLDDLQIPTPQTTPERRHELTVIRAQLIGSQIALEGSDHAKH